MWRLFLSGLLCVPALVILAFGWPNAGGKHVNNVTVAAVPMAAAAQPPAITISLPPAQLQADPPQTDMDDWQLVWIGSLTAAPDPPNPAPRRHRPVRVLPASVSVSHSAGPAPVEQAAPEEPHGTVLARLVRWLTLHESTRVWSSGNGGGSG